MMTVGELDGHVEKGMLAFARCGEDDLIPVQAVILMDGALSFSCPECGCRFLESALIWMSEAEASKEGWVICERSVMDSLMYIS